MATPQDPGSLCQPKLSELVGGGCLPHSKKSIRGRTEETLTLADVHRDPATDRRGVGGIITRYTATAATTGTSSPPLCHGLPVTADYTGEVAKPDCDVVTYTAIFGSTQASEGTAKSLC